MLTPTFSIDSEFIKIMILGIFKYPQSILANVLNFFVLLKESIVATQTSAFQKITPSPPPSHFY